MARPPEVFARPVSMAEGRRLQRIGRTAKDPVKLRRSIVVLMSAQGQPAADIAHLMRVTRPPHRHPPRPGGQPGDAAADPPRRRRVMAGDQDLEIVQRPRLPGQTPPRPRPLRPPAADGRVICVDEFGPLNLLPRAGKVWRPEGRTRRLPATYTRTQGVRHMPAALDLATGKMFYRIKDRKRAKEFLGLLKALRAGWPGEKLYLIADNFPPANTPP
jgi:hypothetical protein